MTYDVDALRALFPSLASGTAHFDGPGGSQTPEPVARAVAQTLLGPISNRGRVTPAERAADDVVRAARAAVADLTGSGPDGVVFGRSATVLTYDLARTLSADWKPGDEVVVTRLDHDANIRPWVQAAEAMGAVVRWAAFDPMTTELTEADLAAVVGPRTRLVALTAASNLTGTRPPVRSLADLAHAVGAHVHIDAVHLAAHASVDLADLGADTLVCSPYKFLGPHCGVLVADPGLLGGLHPDKLLPSSDAVPERFELGTLPYELLAGTTAAIEVLASLSGTSSGPRPDRLRTAFAAIEAHEDALRDQLEQGLAALPGVVVRSRAARRTPTLLLTFDPLSATDAYHFLATRAINAPAGHFYAVEASRWMGLGEQGGLRLGLAPYSCTEDVDRVLAALGELVGQPDRVAR